MLTVESAASFLLDRRLIDCTCILDGSLTVRSAARRNRNLCVERRPAAGFFIKQPDQSIDDGRDTLRREAAFHRFCREEPAAAEVARIVPRMVYDDFDTAILIFELISEADTLWRLLETQGVEHAIIEAARELGGLLAAIHRFFRSTPVRRAPRLDWLTGSLPWVLTLQKPRAELRSGLGQAELETLRILQTQQGLGDHLDRLCRLWRPETLIHGDIKFENVLIRPSAADLDRGSVGLWIVDWEMVRRGDPAWDLAGALHDFLVFWVWSMPLSAELTAEQMIAQARVALTDLRQATRALWSGYKARAELLADEADSFLRRAIEYSAARLIQTAFELPCGAEHLPGRAVILLQLSANLLDQPEFGRIQLYDLPLGSMWS